MYLFPALCLWGAALPCICSSLLDTWWLLFSLYLLWALQFLSRLLSFHSASWFLSHFLWCTEPLTAKVGLDETLTIHTTTELLWKSSSAILAKFNFAPLRKCWAGTACSLKSSGDGEKEERWNEEKRIIWSIVVSVDAATKGMRAVGQHSYSSWSFGGLSVYFVTV